jgi:hypothetical protein
MEVAEVSMRRPLILLIALASAGALRAQEPVPREREWCLDPALCVDDRLEVVFEGGGSVLEIDEVIPGTKMRAIVVMDTKSDGVQGWSYSVRHDREVLRLVSGQLLIKGMCDFCGDPFQSPVFECVDADPRCIARKEGGGFINAVVLALTDNTTLEVGRNALAIAEYELSADPGTEGTFLEFTDRLARKNSPPTAINITVSGRSRAPRTVIDGWVKRRAEPTPFHRGDADGDGRISVADAVGLLLFLFLAGPSPGCLDAADLDDDGRLDTTDAVLILRWLFLGGSAPAPPGPPPGPCGPDPEGPGASPGCSAYPGC